MGKRLLGGLKTWAKGELVLFVLLMVFTLAAGCLDRNHESARSSESAAPGQTVPAQTYSVTGKVKSVTPDRDFIMVRHDAIDGLMEAMTMPFAVPDTALISGVAAGDSVHFEISVSRGNAAVTSLEIRK